jgi:hypothetical protein
MISSIAWVPAGVAAAVPRKYEMSAAERELVRLMEKQGGLLPPDGADSGDDSDDNEKADRDASRRKSSKESKGEVNAPSGASNKSNPLPADLRMDEYSSDDEDDDDCRGYAAGQLLVGSHDDDDQGEEGMEEAESIGDDADSDSNDSQRNEVGRKNRKNDDDDEGSESSSDDDDDLEDVPDTREYVPVDVEGLAAMGLNQIGGVGGGMDFDDDDGDNDDDASDLEDVRISEDDAIVLVAKTEDVRARNPRFRLC